MKYDLQQLNDLLGNLELKKDKLTESEKELRSFFALKSTSIDYYIEHAEIINSLLNCCFEDEAIQSNTSVDKINIVKVYELLRNDLYKYKSKEIKDNNIEFDQIDELEFFNFLNKLYSDPDFIEQHTQKDAELLEQVKEIREKLEYILKYQIKEYFKNTDYKKKKLKEFNFQSKQELYDEAYNRLMHLDISSCLKNIYCKDAVFTVADDVRILVAMLNASETSKHFSKLKSFLNLNSNWSKDKELLINVAAALVCSGTLAAFSASASGASSISEFFASFKQSFTDAFLASSALMLFVDASQRFSQKSRDKNDNKNDALCQKYKQLEDDAFYEAALQIRYNSDAFNALKELKNADQFEMQELLERSKPIESVLRNLKRKLKNLQDKKSFETTHQYVRKSSMTSEEFDKVSSEFLQKFDKFSSAEKEKLLQTIETSQEKIKQIKDLIKAAQLFNKDLSTIKTFDELMRRLKDNSEKKQNAAQEFLTKIFNEAENYEQTKSTSHRIANVF